MTPGVPTPARELYGTMLLERGMAKEALAAFEATLKKEPHRLGADARRRRGGGKVGRCRQGASALRRGRRAHRECRSGQAADRAGPRVRGDKRALRPQATAGRGRAMKPAALAARVVAAGSQAASAGYLRARRAEAREQGGGRHIRRPPGLGGGEVAVPDRSMGNAVAPLRARRPIAAPRSSSIFAPSSAPATARPASRMTPTSIA